VNIIERKYRALVHRRLVPKWMQRITWNREYAIGQWDSRSLHTPNDPIYDVLTEYCLDRNVCDIGSGQGNTVTEMLPVYRSYTGMDVSDVALRIAAKRAAEAGRERVAFIQGFMHSFRPAHKPDVFLFRETLMYVARRRRQVNRDMTRFLQRYAGMLAPGGIMISRLSLSSPSEASYAAEVESIVSQNFKIVECRHTQEPAAQLLVFRPL